MRASLFATVLAIILLLIAVVLLAPYIGLGENYDFVLYKATGVSRGQTFLWLRVFLVLLCTAQLLSVDGLRITSKEHWMAVARSARLAGLQTTRALFVDGNSPPTE